MSSKRSQFRPVLEGLEDRTVPYALSGSSWANLSVTYSFMPDGTDMGFGNTSSLYATLDAVAPREAWQAEIDRAMQTWAAASGLTITRVSDDGSPQGVSGAAQGDPRFGDIRIGARAMSALGQTWYPSTTTRGGDMELTTTHPFNIGTAYDLYSVVLHEAGHALGLAHSDVAGAVMEVVAWQVFNGLHTDDVAGIQALYGPDQPPPGTGLTPDRFEVNDSMATAHNLGTVSSVSQTGLSLHISADLDYFVLVPRKSGTYDLSIRFSNAKGNLDLTVYDASGKVLATSATTADTERVRLSLTGGKRYYIKVHSSTGATNTYDLSVVKPTTGGGKGAALRLPRGPGRRSHPRRAHHHA